MSNHIQLPSHNFTDQLMPRADDPGDSRGEESLLPLIQHWVLVMMVKADKSYKLLSEGPLRGLLKVG